MLLVDIVRLSIITKFEWILNSHLIRSIQTILRNISEIYINDTQPLSETYVIFRIRVVIIDKLIKSWFEITFYNTDQKNVIDVIKKFIMERYSGINFTVLNNIYG